MLVQHRDVVHELFHHGHINEKECENLIAQNNEARVKLEYHPHADEIPDRCGRDGGVPSSYSGRLALGERGQGYDGVTAFGIEVVP